MAASNLAPLHGTGSSTAIANKYIAVFKETLSEEEFAENMKNLQEVFTAAGDTNKIERTFNMGPGFRGFSGAMSADVLEKVRSLPSIKYVEHDQVSTTCQSGVKF